AHDVPLGCAPDEYDDLISGTCSHLPKLAFWGQHDPNTIYASANDVILPNLALGTGVLIAAWVYIRYLKR
ncbi:hypothetical protein EJ893_07505, partial [Klebsiella pneumoniae subsp. pneumoniae]